ncbi:MAG TPA: hypothetical protein VHN17_06350 [Steroidobacteraceae bacterium]|jgi:hypothetical protein|nr:hypothetical protein [Steroidobacteraceae bacterium]
MHVERLKLHGSDWARYFAPVGFCLYLAAICVALIVTSAFLHNLREALAVSAAATFGLLLSGALGMGVLGMQLHELRYLPVATAFDTEANFDLVLHLARDLGWQVNRAQPGQRLDFRTADSMLQQGELVVVLFRERQVLIACICDPGVGFSLVGRRRCQRNRELVRRAVLRMAP